MHEEEFFNLAKIRLERSKELLEEAELLLEGEHYKAANNRAFYSIEKSINCLLAMKQVVTKTHKGCILQFNELFVKTGEGDFSKQDFIEATNSERIRSVSDYNDFYIANKQETIHQVEFAKSFYEKVKKYVDEMQN